MWTGCAGKKHLGKMVDLKVGFGGSFWVVIMIRWWEKGFPGGGGGSESRDHGGRLIYNSTTISMLRDPGWQKT